MVQLSLQDMSWSIWLLLIVGGVFGATCVVYSLRSRALPTAAYRWMVAALLAAGALRLGHCSFGTKDCPMDTNGLKNSSQLVLLLLIYGAIVHTH